MKDNNILSVNPRKGLMGVLVHFSGDNPDVSPESRYKALMQCPGKVSRRNRE